MVEQVERQANSEKGEDDSEEGVDNEDEEEERNQPLRRTTFLSLYLVPRN